MDHDTSSHLCQCLCTIMYAGGLESAFINSPSLHFSCPPPAADGGSKRRPVERKKKKISRAKGRASSEEEPNNEASHPEPLDGATCRCCTLRRSGIMMRAQLHVAPLLPESLMPADRLPHVLHGGLKARQLRPARRPTLSGTVTRAARTLGGRGVCAFSTARFLKTQKSELLYCLHDRRR